MRSCVRRYFVPCAHGLKCIQASLHAFLCKLKFSFLPVYIMLNQDNQPIPLPIYPLFWLCHMYTIYLSCYLYSSIWEIFSVFSCRIYWKISKSLFWILLRIWFLAVGERLRESAKRNWIQDKDLNKHCISKQANSTQVSHTEVSCLMPAVIF